MTDRNKGTALVPRPSQEARRIRRMFGEIAPRYDLLNHLLSGGTDISWRNIVVRDAVNRQQRHILDVACGTGDLAFAIRRAAHPDARVVGVDFTEEMLRIAQDKTGNGYPGGVKWAQADGLRLPFADNSFDLVTIAFGIRNMESLSGALREFLRVLRPGGEVAILEFSQPENFLVRSVYHPYFLHVLPRIGALLSQKQAYMYLPFSVMHFPTRRELARMMKREGFREVRHASLSLGIAALHLGRKPRRRSAP
jgi:demethylmenaquinone methyltransferase/2-methoxy-6-polyprenyl-1,4-benzoquinol methylase